MAHPICGIDVGAYSIKFVVFEVGFRHTIFRGAFEEMVNVGATPLIERQIEALREGLSRVSSDATLYLALPGDALSIRSMKLPFQEQRKIDQVIGYELEGQIVHALDEVVFDHVTLRLTDEGSDVLAVAAKRDVVSAWLEALERKGIDPRALYAAPVVYHALRIEAGAAAATPPDSDEMRVPAILDLGHARSNLFLGQDGTVIVARTITRGGQHVTAGLAQALGVDLSRAEQIKRGGARLIPTGVVPTGANEARIDQALRTALAPLCREVRQTLASFRASTRMDVSTLYLTGGTARLKGILPFLEQELELSAVFLTVPNTLQESSTPLEIVRPELGSGVPLADFDDGDMQKTTRVMRQASESTPFALATAIGMAASRGGREIDLRRGPFLYRASFSILRQKAAHLALLAAAIVVAAGLDVFAALSNLGAERKALNFQLKTATQELFGAPRSDATTVTQLLRKGFKEELAPVPKATAFDLLDQISKRMPPADRIKLDIGELEIRSKKTFIKGTVDSATAVDEISDRLKEIDCYDEVTKGTVTEVSDGAKQFTLNVGAKCP